MGEGGEFRGVDEGGGVVEVDDDGGDVVHGGGEVGVVPEEHGRVFGGMLEDDVDALLVADHVKDSIAGQHQELVSGLDEDLVEVGLC